MNVDAYPMNPMIMKTRRFFQRSESDPHTGAITMMMNAGSAEASESSMKDVAFRSCLTKNVTNCQLIACAVAMQAYARYTDATERFKIAIAWEPLY